MPTATVRVHNPDLSISEIQFESGGEAAEIIKLIREGCRIQGGFLKCEGVVVRDKSTIMANQLYDFTDAILTGTYGSAALINSMTCKLVNTFMNPWNGDRASRNVDPSFRASLKTGLGINSKFAPCMISTQMGGAEQVIVGHILPRHTQVSVLEELHFDKDNLSSTRNVLFLAANIHKCYERLQLSFVPVSHVHPSASSYKMVILDPSIASVPIWDGHKCTIGMFADHYMDMSGHSPYRRALAFQAYMAHNNRVFGSTEALNSSNLPELFFEKQRELEMIYKGEIPPSDV